MERVDIKAILADPEQRADLLSNVFDPGPDGTHIPEKVRQRVRIKVGTKVNQIRCSRPWIAVENLLRRRHSGGCREGE